MEEQRIIELADGNPGAANFLSTLFKSPFVDEEQKKVIAEKLENCPSIRGTNIYILYNDLCDRNIKKVAQLCGNCPDNILEDACNRQDRSGKQLVSEYFKEEN